MIGTLQEIISLHFLDYATKVTSCRSIHTDSEWWRCYHSLELDYIFGSPIQGYNIATDRPQNHTDDDRRFSSVLMKLWTNFAKNRCCQGIQQSNKSCFHEMITLFYTLYTFSWFPVPQPQMHIQIFLLGYHTR